MFVFCTTTKVSFSVVFFYAFVTWLHIKNVAIMLAAVLCMVSRGLHAAYNVLSLGFRSKIIPSIQLA